MSAQSLECTVAEAVAEITLNRPEVLNAFDRPMATAFLDSLQTAATDSAIRAILIKANGRAFCAGQDIVEISTGAKSPPPSLSTILEERYNPIVRALRYTEKPIVVAVNGIAAGAGANLALACDFVVAAEDAHFVQAFAKVGLLPDSAGTFFLPRLVGLARATALTMLGEKLSAKDAVAIGLIYAAVPAAKLVDEARSLARKLATGPTYALGLTKRALNQSLYNDLDNQLDLERDLQGLAGDSTDYKEGIAAFHEKRTPLFTGRPVRGAK